MRVARATGRNAAVMKYDLLTALGSHACAGDKHLQRLVLRFITLIVARYNWQSDELSVGQREMAELWSVDERTVKRDIARLRGLGWLVVKREAARGRVALHGLGVEAILRRTEGDWARVGSDFVGRMAQPAADPPQGNVVAFPGVARIEGQGLWAEVQRRLQAENPALYLAWFAKLTAEAGEDGVLRLTAPTRFHADFVKTHYLDRVRALASNLSPGEVSVEIGAD